MTHPGSGSLVSWREPSRRFQGRLGSPTPRHHDSRCEADGCVVAGSARPRLPAARNYLSLVYVPEVADALAEALRAAVTIHTYQAKDILRASRLRPLGRKNFHVGLDLVKITKGEKLSPVLLVRDAVRAVLVIADGFHRVCASRLVNEDLIIPCRIVTAP
jgi:hypothetical protein